MGFVLPTDLNRSDVLSFYDETKNGGVLENKLFDPEENVFVKRHRIKL